MKFSGLGAKLEGAKLLGLGAKRLGAKLLGAKLLGATSELGLGATSGLGEKLLGLGLEKFEMLVKFMAEFFVILISGGRLHQKSI